MQPGEVTLERPNGSIAVVSLRGEHDLSTVPSVREKVDEAIGDGAGLVVDLSSAEFIDSSILGAVIEAGRRSEAGGLAFAVALENPAGPVERVLEVTGLAESMPIHESAEAAIAAVAAGGEAGG